jgi:hypothetical protein
MNAEHHEPKNCSGTLLMRLPEREQVEIALNGNCVLFAKQDAVGSDPAIVAIPMDDVPSVIECLQTVFASENRA